MSNPETRVVLFQEDEAGYLIRGDAYSVDVLGGLPEIGDLIVDPAVLEGLNRNDPSNRDVSEVVRRYFVPRDDEAGPAFVHLVVVTRLGTSGEAEILGS